MPDVNQRPRYVEGRQVLDRMQRGGWEPAHRDLVRAALTAGCKVRMGKTSNHVVVSNDYGGTTTLGSGGNGRGSKALKNYAADMNRVIAEQEAKHSTQPDNRPLPTPRAFVGHDPGLPEMDEPEETVVEVIAKYAKCDICKPPQMLPDQAALDAHKKELHVQCPECEDWLRSKAGLGGHKSIKHGTSKPWEHRTTFPGRPRKKTEEKRNGQASPPATTPVPRQASPSRTSSKLLDDPTIRRVVDTELPDPAILGAVLNEANKLEQIRGILGEDPRLDMLRTSLATETRRADQAEAKVELMREALATLQQAAEI